MMGLYTYRFSNYVSTIIGLLALLILLSVLAIGGSKLFHTFYGDSGIYLSYAKNIAHGNFFDFNPGYFSSGSTSPLWAVLLSPAFWFTNSLFMIKVISLGFTLLAFVTLYFASKHISSSPFAAAISLGLCMYFLPINGFLGFESPLIIILLSVLIILNYNILNYNSKQRLLLLLTIVWACIPLTRPDATSIVLVNVVMLLFMQKNKGRVFFAAVCAAIPALVYVAYSKLTLGLFSVSAYCRAFALRENSPVFLGLHYSSSLLSLLFRAPIVYWVVYILVGSITLFYLNRSRWLFGMLFVILLLYIIMLSIISPVTSYAARYALPIVPFLAVAMAIITSRMISPIIDKPILAWLMLAPVAVLVLINPISVFHKAVSSNEIHPYTAATIFEKPLVIYLNKTLRKNTVILFYEVQDRFYLRKDLQVLSLDGITDGKVAPYLASGNMQAFLNRYKPNYWVANKAVYYRKFLESSILRKVMDKTTGKLGASITFGNITFTNIKIRKKPSIKGFSNYLDVYHLTYS